MLGPREIANAEQRGYLLREKRRGLIGTGICGAGVLGLGLFLATLPPPSAQDIDEAFWKAAMDQVTGEVAPQAAAHVNRFFQTSKENPEAMHEYRIYADGALSAKELRERAEKIATERREDNRTRMEVAGSFLAAGLGISIARAYRGSKGLREWKPRP